MAVPKIPKKEYHEARELKEREAALRCDDEATAKLHRELAERHRVEATRPEEDPKPAFFRH